MGIFLDHNLTWMSHIKHISSKLSRVLFLLRELKDFVPNEHVKSAYFAFFQSVILYGLLLWGNSSHISDILLLQKKAVRLLTNLPPLTHCKPLFRELGIMTVINLYILQCVMHVKSNISNFIVRRTVHSYPTRNREDLHVPFNRLSISQKNYSAMSLKIFNHFPHKVTELPVNDLKDKLTEWLTNNPFYDINEFLSIDRKDLDI